ncbi:MAG: ferritin-like domain-containing protein [Actinobacteria bacterium]|nr:ferritin-like domain-containing protein [Actinomycetota bacterium]
MTTSENAKLVQYLNEAHATEMALVRILQEQIAMTPRGRYRSALETHLRETRSHADRVASRRRELQGGGNPIAAIVGTAQDVIGQAIALAKTPLDLLRGSGGEEKVLKNAKDACATEALEIATYIALEELARAVDDKRTAELAASIRDDEEAMLERIQRELPALTRAVVAADIEGRGSYDISETGAAETVRDVAEDTEEIARSTAEDAKRTATRQARRVPGEVQVEGAVKGAVASEEDLPIPAYDSLTADEILERLPQLSQVDLAKVEVYERKEIGRRTVLDRIASLRGDEPWAGYDEMTAPEVIERVRDGDDDLAAAVREYERTHKARTTVLRAAERELSHA